MGVAIMSGGFYKDETAMGKIDYTAASYVVISLLRWLEANPSCSTKEFFLKKYFNPIVVAELLENKNLIGLDQVKSLQAMLRVHHILHSGFYGPVNTHSVDYIIKLRDELIHVIEKKFKSLIVLNLMKEQLGYEDLLVKIRALTEDPEVQLAICTDEEDKQDLEQVLQAKNIFIPSVLVFTGDGETLSQTLCALAWICGVDMREVVYVSSNKEHRDLVTGMGVGVLSRGFEDLLSAQEELPPYKQTTSFSFGRQTPSRDPQNSTKGFSENVPKEFLIKNPLDAAKAADYIARVNRYFIYKPVEDGDLAGDITESELPAQQVAVPMNKM